MRNSSGPVPWTQRDSRPKSQAELDQEESFNVYRRMKILRPIPSDLHKRLEHYQQMITRILADEEFRKQIELDAGTSFERAMRSRAEKTREHIRKKGLYSSTSAQREARRQERIKASKPAQPELFRHFERIFSEPEPPKALRAPRERTLEDLYREYHIDTPELRAAWLPALSRLLPKSTL